MKRCRICGDILTPEEKFRGTCDKCESAIAKLINKKALEGMYSRKARLKF